MKSKINNINSIVRIMKIELNTMFYSPIAWLLLIVFAFQVGSVFFGNLDYILHNKDIGNNVNFNLTHKVFSEIFMGEGIYKAVIKYLYLYIPLITMGLMSKEYSSGSIKLLYTSPIKSSSIILGKFSSMIVYGLFLIGIILFFILIAGFSIENFVWEHAFAGLLGVLLLLLSYSAIGLFVSTLTSYQVVAAVGTLIVLSILNTIGSIGQSIDFVRDITYWLSMSGRVYTFVKGMIVSEDVVYFITVICLFLMLSILKLEAQRNRRDKNIIIGKYIGLFVSVIVIGFISIRPSMKLYYDATATKSNTISQESQSIVNKLENDLKITTYVNILDDFADFGLPSRRVSDLKYFEKYVRFKPNISMKYVYYYDKVYNPKLFNKYKDKTIEELAQYVCDIKGLKFSDIKSPKEMKKIIDLSSEGNQLVKILEYSDDKGNKSYSTLRTFNDMGKLPSESEISGGMRRFIEKLPVVAYVSGKCDRGIYNNGLRGYDIFASRKRERSSLINNSFDVIEVDLSKQDIPNDVTILIIPDLKTELNNTELNKITNYIDNGGDLIILGDVDKQSNINKITSYVGVELKDNMLVEKSDIISPEIIMSVLDSTIVNHIPIFNLFNNKWAKISMPTTTAIDYKEIKGFKVHPVLKTNKKGVWIETDVNDFIDVKPSINIENGESEGEYITMVALERTINGHNQKIFVSGDADWMSNSEIIVKRDIQNNNLNLISSMFRWLTDYKFPVYAGLPPSRDNGIKFNPQNKHIYLPILSYMLGVIILICSVIIIYRRKQN